MSATFKGVTFINNGVGISAPRGAELTFDGGHFEGNGTGILIRDPRQLCDELGLSRSVDLKSLKDVLDEFAQKKATGAVVQAELSSGRMKGWLAAGPT
jgi:hypothetical protein